MRVKSDKTGELTTTPYAVSTAPDKPVETASAVLKPVDARASYRHDNPKAPSGFVDVRKLPKCIYIYGDDAGDKKAGKKCGAIRMNGSEHCYQHTPRELRDQLQTVSKHKNALIKGRTKTGIPVTRLRSLALPKDMAEKYDLIVTDPELISLKTDVAFTEARIQRITQHTRDTGESRKIRHIIRKTVKHALNQMNRGMISAKTALDDIERAVDSDYATQLKWEEVYLLTAEKRKLVSAEAQRVKDLEAYLTIEQGMAIVTALVAIAAEFIDGNRMEAFTERVGNVMRMTKGNFSETAEVVSIDSLRKYDEVVALYAENHKQDVEPVVETTEGVDGVYEPQENADSDTAIESIETSR